MFSRFSVKKPYTIFVAVVLIFILGTISFLNLTTDLLPSMDLPYVVVNTSYEGASPEEVETVVTRPLEQSLATTNNIQNVSSVSSENSSMIILEFSNDVNLDSAIIEINSMIDMITPYWGEDISTPMIMRLNPDMMPIMISALNTEEQTLSELSDYATDTIIPELESVEGVASVEGTGLVEEDIQVELLPDKIEDYNDRILDEIDGELSKSEQELEEAKRDIENGIKSVEKEEEVRLGEIEDGRNAINDAHEELLLGQHQMDQAESELRENRTTLDATIAGLEALEGILTQGELVEEFGLFEEQLGDVQSQKAELEAARGQLESGLSNLSSQQKELFKGEAELSAQRDALMQGEMILRIELSNAKRELQSGLTEIEKGLQELENAKEEAFKNADLKGMITVEMISNILMAQNFSMPAGYLEQEGIDYLIKVGEEFEQTEELENLLLFDTGMDSVGELYLKDVANIGNNDNQEGIYAKVNGENAVMLVSQKQSNYSTAQVSESLREKIEEINEEDNGVEIVNLMDQGIYIDMVVESVLNNLMYGGILAVLILLVFLKDLRPTIVIGLSIPISLIFAIAMMYFTGVTINIISLGGLALGVGMLVDNSVVVIENIYRLKNEGMSAAKASVEGAKQVSGALAASTFTTMAVFLPVIFTDGISRQIFTDMGLTIAFSLLASLIIAITLVPVMSSGFFKNVESKKTPFFDRMIAGYEVILQKALNVRVFILLMTVVLLAGSVYFATQAGTAFIPEMEAAEMSATIEADDETTFEELSEIGDQASEAIMEIEGIVTVGAFAGESSGFGFGGGSSGGAKTISLNILLDQENPADNEFIEREILERTKDLDAAVSVSGSNMDLSALSGEGIQLQVKGPDIDRLREISEGLRVIIEETEGTMNVQTSFDEEQSEEIRVRIDKNEAMKEGLTVAQIYSQIRGWTSDGQNATTLTVDNKDYPVMVFHGKNKAINVDNLLEQPLEVEENSEMGMPSQDMQDDEEEEEKELLLGDVANIEQTTGLASINRDSQQRYVNVSAEPQTGYNIGLVSRDIEAQLEEFDLPEGYNVEIGGETETINETMTDLMLMIALAVVFVYLIMVAQFQSLLSPFIVMFTIPLAFTGGFMAMLITGSDVSIISMLGLLVLSGIVVNNGIVFVDYIDQLREDGMEKREAIILAGKTRLRPILMTAITTILGLSTLSVGMGMGSDMLQPLAITAIGGLTYSTLLTLFVVPIMYDLMHRKKRVKREV
ncbi:MAG TPA: acriflavin resistance protein [Eubacteriaceae bacterium]|nr:acriflavin resistance protein [Eubacteriaceae bacterium]